MTFAAERLVWRVGEADAGLDQELSDRLDEFNAEATAGTAAARELTVRAQDDDGRLIAGISGWTWGVAGGIGMVWVHPDARGHGVGGRLLRDFEVEAAGRGCTHVFVTSFTFQAPEFYERNGYRQIFRWEGVPTAGHSDIHFRKDL
ncbi:acetyltransferase (GNAT) family protein [Kribbella amoyensis]|uniref:Acetyltransferase (GNAT) family protein n=1 Tax=Kribbella amoyensis TaxID=996641 RepID=A0A561BT70_9ACTN|nr:GNAT family N-acetyltransferase [Kribbella amoyensis]TWD82087.1 acetyltransferase (GNAT) family protein [Kribbella amoyensis]